MSKAKPIPDSIERLPGGTEKAQCAYEGGPICRSYYGNDQDRPLPWVHVETGFTTCERKK
jgi:hypothetical protein